MSTFCSLKSKRVNFPYYNRIIRVEIPNNLNSLILGIILWTLI